MHEDIHRPGDTPDKIDYAGLVRTARVLQEIVGYLVERPESLTTRLQGAASRAIPAGGKRRVSLGTVPDYAFTGEGVLIDDIRSDSPAAQAGLRKGDIIIAVNGTRVMDLRDYAEVLRRLGPGDSIRIRYRRDDQEQEVGTQVILR